MRRTSQRTEPGDERRPGRVLAVLVGFVIAAGVLLPSASSQEAGVARYAATMSPTTATAGTETSFTVKLTNCGPLTPPCTGSDDTGVSVAPMSSATITFPQGFVVDRDSITVQTSAPLKTWTVSSVSTDSISGTTIGVAAATPLGALLLGESISVTVRAVPKASGLQTITTRALAGSLEFSQIGDEPTVEVNGTDREATVVTCSANSCTGSATHDGTTVTATATGGWQAGDVLTIAIVDRNTEQCPNYAADPNSYGGVVYLQRSSTASTPTLSIDWRLAKDKVNLTPNNGAESFNEICYGGQKDGAPTATFPTKDGGTSTLGTDGQQWGVLPDCAAGAADPCISKRSKNKAGDAVVTTKSPWPWDPAVYGG
jgi:hypothetical protein